ncbi:MAG: methyl-accepting chemotaxis protein [Candidatus Cloacimonetes bacterium]|nr:methyl-accepting chemotaxis protein [Candidatus Cloacimonadota bacterium]
MLKNAKIGMKLGVGFGILIVVMLIISIVSITNLNKIRIEENEIMNKNLIKLNVTNEIYNHINTIARNLRNIALSKDPNEIKRYRQLIDHTLTLFSPLVEQITPLISDQGEEKILFSSYQGSRAELVNQLNIAYSIIDNNQKDKLVSHLFGDYRKSQDQYFKTIETFITYQTNEMNNSGKDINKYIENSIITVIVSIVIGLIIALTLAILITKMITKPINECVKVANELANGNTAVNIDVDSQDETGILSLAMKKMIDSIKEMYNDATYLSEAAIAGKLKTRADVKKHKGDFAKIVNGVNETLDAVINPITEAMQVMKQLADKNLTARVTGNYNGDLNTFKEDINLAAQDLEESLIQVDMAVEQITAASNQISSGSQILAEATSEQASSLEEISSSLEEINSLTANNADNAKNGLNLSEQAVKAVDEGNIAMEKMNNAMASILQSSQETGKIIKTIDEIAFQTNLLALNAAVEAAHAGEAGKGFAVVAEEVKNLALRSADAAKNTNALIEEATKNSEMGSNIVEQVTKSFIEMKEQFTKVKSIVNEITASSEEQAHGVNQISSGVEEMNRVTQQNAANAEESASAAEELNSQAAELKNMVNQFTLSQKRHSYNNSKKPNKQIPNERRNTKQIPHQKPKNSYELNPENILPLDNVDDDDFDDFK